MSAQSDNFKDIYESYARKVYRYLLSLVGDVQTAEELTQETFYKALIHINSFKGDSSLFTWLCRIGRNLWYNQLRSQKHLSRNADVLDVLDSLDTLGSQSPVSENFLNRLFDREQAILVHKVLHTLSEPYKEVFSLKVFGELKYKEIAEIFGKTESWAKVTYYRAKEQIVKKLREEEE